VCGRQHCRVHSDGDLAFDVFGDGHELHRVSQPLGERDIAVGYVRYSLPIDIARNHSRTEGHRGQDGRLRCRIEALDVGRGILFGITEPLGLGQGLGERHPRLGHAAEDEVGRAVHDPYDPLDPFAGQRLLQGANDGDPPGHGRLVEQIHARLVGGLEELGPQSREQLLVRTDNGLAHLDRLEDGRAGGLDPTHDLHHDVDARVGHDLTGIVGEEALVQLHIALLGQVAYGHAPDLHIRADGSGDGIGFTL
jgi:hypothetical protein